MPEGVLQLVTGDAEDAPVIGGELTSNPAVRKLSFTGSTEIGKLLMAQCADTVKKVSLELGGNAPFVVFDDADLEAAIDGAILCKFRNSGQTCISANRILVQDGVHDEFVARFDEAVGALKVGNGLDDGVQVGPLIDGAAVEKVEWHVADATSRGAELVRGGSRLEGTFFEPTVLTGVTSAMAMSCRGDLRPGRRNPAVRDRSRRRSSSRTTHRTASLRTSTAATSAGSGASRRGSSTGSSASTPASSPPRWRRSAA